MKTQRDDWKDVAATEPVYDYRAAARYIGVTPPTILRRWRAGKMPQPHLEVHGKPFWTRSQLDAHREA